MELSCINNVSLISSLYVCMAIKHIIVLFVETPRKFTWCFHKQNYYNVSLVWSWNFFQNPPPSDRQIEEFFNSSQQIDGQVDNLLNDSNVQGALQFLQTVSGMLNERSNRSEQRGERTEVCCVSCWAYPLSKSLDGGVNLQLSEWENNVHSYHYMEMSCIWCK